MEEELLEELEEDEEYNGEYDYDEDNDDYCYECTGYGDDYYVDENGELVCVCDTCPYNSANIDDD